VRYRAFGVALEGRYDLPASTSGANGGASAQLATLAIVPCLHFGVLLGCARASWGEVIGEGRDVSTTETRAAPYVALGARAGGELPLVGPLEVRGHVDVDLALTKTTLLVNTNEVWKSPLVGVTAGLAALVRFP
jgi:hypothetical protein